MSRCKNPKKFLLWILKKEVTIINILYWSELFPLQMIESLTQTGWSRKENWLTGVLKIRRVNLWFQASPDSGAQVLLWGLSSYISVLLSCVWLYFQEDSPHLKATMGTSNSRYTFYQISTSKRNREPFPSCYNRSPGTGSGGPSFGHMPPSEPITVAKVRSSCLMGLGWITAIQSPWTQIGDEWIL